MRNGYTDYSFVTNGKEYVSDTEYYEIQEEVENERRNDAFINNRFYYRYDILGSYCGNAYIGGCNSR